MPPDLLDLRALANVFALVSLDPLKPLLAAHYAHFHAPTRKGRTPRDPIVMFRSYLIMSIIDDKPGAFVTRLHHDPLLALVCGLSPGDKLPASSSLYDFANRLLNGPYRPPCACHPPQPAARASNTRFLRHLARERQDHATDPGECRRRVSDALARLGDRLCDDFTTRINAILHTLAVARSIDLGVLGDPAKLHANVDSTVLKSHANIRGRKACDCDTRCDCPRWYSDPDAQIGVDTSNEAKQAASGSGEAKRLPWFFGYKGHAVTVHHDHTDLPIHLQVTPGNASDVITGVDVLERLTKRLRDDADANGKPSAKLATGAFDAGYDAEPFYHYLRELGIKPVIPLKPKSEAAYSHEDTKFDTDGTPLCPGGAPMRRHSVTPANKMLYYCPAKKRGRGGAIDMSFCPTGSLCEPESKMGPQVLIALEGNERFHVEISRSSSKFKELYNKRTSIERFFNTAKRTRRKHRRGHLFALDALGKSIHAHGKAWLKRCPKEELETWRALGVKLDRLIALEEAKAELCNTS